MAVANVALIHRFHHHHRLRFCPGYAQPMQNDVVMTKIFVSSFDKALGYHDEKSPKHNDQTFECAFSALDLFGLRPDIAGCDFRCLIFVCVFCRGFAHDAQEHI
jgi:hypothetical protein